LQAIKEIKEKLVPFTNLLIYHTEGLNYSKVLIYIDCFGAVALYGLCNGFIDYHGFVVSMNAHNVKENYRCNCGYINCEDCC
jgi:hypothetical protein